MDNQKKISLVETLLVILLSLFADIVDVLFNLMALIPVIGLIMLFIAPIFSLLFFAVTEFWLIMKGGVGFRQQISVIVGNLADIIPFVSFLPFKTVSVVIAIYMINHPKIAEVVSATTGNLSGKIASIAAVE